jgi:opacity protein-like surface antigen
MSMYRLSLGTFVLGLLMTCHAVADEYSGPYLGASFGQARLAVEDTPFHEKASAFKAFVGYAVSDLLAMEVSYVDGGAPTLDLNGSSVEAQLSGVNASVLLRARKGSAFAFFLKLGYASYEIESTGVVNGAPLLQGTDSEEDVTAGIGASYLFARRVIVRLEYEALKVDDGEFTLLTLGAGYKF